MSEQAIKTHALLLSSATSVMLLGQPALAQTPAVTGATQSETAGVAADQRPPGDQQVGQQFKVEEIIVTASKREESILKTPQSVAAITGAQLEAIGAQDFRGVEHPAAAQRNLERAKVIGCREVDVDALRVVWRLPGDRVRGLVAAQGQANANGLDARQSTNPFHQLEEETIPLVRSVELRRRQPRLQGRTAAVMGEDGVRADQER